MLLVMRVVRVIRTILEEAHRQPTARIGRAGKKKEKEKERIA